MSNLGEIIDRIGTLDEEIKRLEKEKKDLLGPLKENVTSSGNLAGRVYMIEFKQSKGRKTYDTKAMADDGIDIEQYAKVGAPFITTSIKPIQRV